MLRFFFLFTLSSTAFAELTELSVVARVANQSISNRDLEVFQVLSNPLSFRANPPHVTLSKDEQELLVQELIIQVLVEEENKILGIGNVSDQAVQRELRRLKRGMGNRQWKLFLEAYDLSLSTIQERMKRMLVVENTLQLQLEDAMRTVGKEDNKQEAAERNLRSWLQRLRSRYRVMIMNDPNWNQAIDLNQNSPEG